MSTLGQIGDQCPLRMAKLRWVAQILLDALEGRCIAHSLFIKDSKLLVRIRLPSTFHCACHEYILQSPDYNHKSERSIYPSNPFTMLSHSASSGSRQTGLNGLCRILEDPQPFSATTKILNRRLTALQVGRLKVLIFRRAGAGFTAELTVEITQLVQQNLFRRREVRVRKRGLGNGVARG